MKRDIGRRIRRRRIVLRLSQKQVAEKLGRVHSWIAQVERGEIQIDDAITTKILSTIDRLAQEAVEDVAMCFDDLRLRDRRRRETR